MRRQILFLFLAFFIGANAVAADCDVDTAFFKLPQNEFNIDQTWWSGLGDFWTGDISYYNMYDPCEAAANTIVITEANLNAGNAGSYMELTNLGAVAVDLAPYRLVLQRNDKNFPEIKVTRMSHIQLSGMLEPGESYIVSSYFRSLNAEKGVMDRADSLNTHNVLLDAISNLSTGVERNNPVPPYVVGRTLDILTAGWKNNVSLVKVVNDTVEVIVDVLGQLYVEGDVPTVAGLPNAISSFTLVRKQFTEGRTWGNPNFIIGAGAESAAASEWITVPKFRPATKYLPTTIGSFNSASSFSLAAKDGSGYVVDATTITIPWGTYKGDPVLEGLVVGDDMSWEYQTNGVAEEDASKLVHAGDTITFYHCGADVTIKSYRIEVATPASDNANTFALNGLYNETNGLEVDTIYGRRLTYNYSVDTLLQYFETAAGLGSEAAREASLSIVFKDGNKKPEVSEGDILRVTAIDGTTTHDYYIALIDYKFSGLSHDPRLSLISWPDYPVDELDDYVWTTGDTIPSFNTDGYNYNITLPAGTEEIPALMAMPLNPRASMRVVPAENLFGSVEDQTYKFIVTAEDDSTIATYSIRFLVEVEEAEFEGEPFFSEITHNFNTGASVIFEICNPGNVPLDLSDYAVAHGKVNAKTMSGILQWKDTYGFFDNSRIYRPGYVYDSLTMNTNQQYWWDPNGDGDVDAFMEPGGVFSMSCTRSGSSLGAADPETGLWYDQDNTIGEGPNVILVAGPDNDRGWSWNKHAGNAIDMVGRIVYSKTAGTSNCNTFFLVKILNDSVKIGLKGGMDPNDYEIVDVFGKIESASTMGFVDPSTGNTFSVVGTDFLIQRKPNIYKGNPVSMGSFGYAGIETAASYDATSPVLGDTAAFEWVIKSNRPAYYNVGQHTLDPVTVYKSNVNSATYIVSLGLSMDELIVGVPAGTTAGEFLANIIKLNPGQSLKMTDASGSIELFDTDIVQNTDMLTVVSADGVNTTAYSITAGDLNSDVSLKSTSSDYVVSASAVSIPNLSTTLKTLKASLSVAATSKIYFANKIDGLAPLTAVNRRDTTYYDALALDGLSVKVVAQNGASKLYALKVVVGANEAFISSSYYTVDQDEKTIYGVFNGTNVEEILANINASEGATARVVNKWKQNKAFGPLFFNDVVVVTSGNTEVVYGITLQSELIPELPLAISESSVSVEKVVVSPNPTKGALSLNSTSVASVTVSSITGVVVKEFANPESKIDISSLSAGVYLVAVKDIDGSVETVKVVKQ